MEVWKDIKGFEGLYQISNYGNGRSLDRTIERKSRWGKIIKVTYKGVYLKKNKTGKGYRRFDLCKNGIYTYASVHRLVWKTFVGAIPEDYEIDHVVPIADGGGDELSNLRLVTRKENMHNENTYKKYFTPCSDDKKEKLAETSKGKHYSPNTEFKKGCESAFKGHKHTEENKKRLAKLHSKGVDQISLVDGEVVNSYDSAKIAAEKCGFKLCGISAAATGRIQHYKGFKWLYRIDGV